MADFSFYTFLFVLLGNRTETRMFLCVRTNIHTQASGRQTHTDRLVSYLETTCQSEWHLWGRWLEEVFILSSQREASAWCVDLLDRARRWGHIFHSSVMEEKKQSSEFLNDLITFQKGEMRQHNIIRFIYKDISLSGVSGLIFWFLLYPLSAKTFVFDLMITWGEMQMSTSVTLSLSCHSSDEEGAAASYFVPHLQRHSPV